MIRNVLISSEVGFQEVGASAPTFRFAPHGALAPTSEIAKLTSCLEHSCRLRHSPIFARREAKTAIFLGIMIAAALLILAPSNARAQTATPNQKPDSTPAGNIQNGKKLFTSYGCYECHGHQAEGTSAGGPRLGPNPIPLSALVKYVRQPSGQMPPFTSKVVSDSELNDIYAFLQSLPQPPRADSIPALK
jgi:mono/diheme cytochrome c family protein